MPGVVASVNVNEAEPQPSLAVGEENTGVAGQKIVALAPTPLIEGPVRSLVHVTVFETVAVLPQTSTAVKVRICVTVQFIVVTAASLGIIVTAPHASVAVALPSAAVILDAVVLQPSGTLA